MQKQTTSKLDKYQDRELELVGRARPKMLDQVGFVEKKGRNRILRGEGHVEIFFPEREDRHATYYTKRVFLAQYAQFLG